MKVAITYDNGQIFQHFGKCEQFLVVTIKNNTVESTETLDATGNGHSALSGFLKANGVSAVICGGIGQGALDALAEAEIEVFAGQSGSAENILQMYLQKELSAVCVSQCNHHNETAHVCGCKH